MDISKIKEKNLAIINAELKELTSQIDLKDCVDIDYQCQRDLIGLYLEHFRDGIESEDHKSILLNIMYLGSLEFELESLPDGIIQKFGIDSIKKKIKKISNRLWQLLAPLNLDSWSISGNANINMLGLSGGITLQLNFK